MPKLERRNGSWYCERYRLRHHGNVMLYRTTDQADSVRVQVNSVHEHESYTDELEAVLTINGIEFRRLIDVDVDDFEWPTE